MVQKKTTCHVCHEAVGSREHECESAFLTLKHRGNLFKPAASVISVCNETEKCFQELDEHMLDTTVNDNHVFKLIKTVSKCYCKVQLYQLGKTTTEMSTITKVIKKLNKRVLFEHQ